MQTRRRGVPIDGDVMLRARVNAGLSMRQLSEQTGIARDTLTRIEAGEQWPMPATIKRIADALAIEPASLIALDTIAQDADQGKAIAA